MCRLTHRRTRTTSRHDRTGTRWTPASASGGRPEGGVRLDQDAAALRRTSPQCSQPPPSQPRKRHPQTPPCARGDRQSERSPRRCRATGPNRSRTGRGHGRDRRARQSACGTLHRTPPGRRLQARARPEPSETLHPYGTRSAARAHPRRSAYLSEATCAHPKGSVRSKTQSKRSRGAPARAGGRAALRRVGRHGCSVQSWSGSFEIAQLRTGPAMTLR